MYKCIGVAAAGFAAASLPVASHAAIVSMVDIDKLLAPGESYSLPGIPDFTFRWDPTLKIDAKREGAAFGRFVGAGVVVGPDNGDYPLNTVSAAFGSAFSTKPGEGFLGFQFMLDESLHYGWVELSVTGLPAEPSATIHGFGFEDVAGTPILTGALALPEPDALALAAAGLLATVCAGRRRRKSPAH
jgi:hypothetical protein